MIEACEKFYVTTPIYYVTARPHLGSLYSTVLADVAARYHSLLGKKTFFLTGTDEHGQKIAQAAAAVGMEPKKFVDQFIDAYKQTWKSYEIEYNAFIRTTDTYHVHAVQQWLKDLMDKGDIYFGSYRGWYCTPCETFVAEAAEGEKEGDVICPTCGRGTVLVSEDAYFFRLSSYQEKLLEFYYSHPHFITPKERMQEVLSFVAGGLKDLCLSRTSITWGIPFPGNEKHVTYVWADALNNYITAIGYQQPGREKEFNFWWPADLHVMGKDIIRFHAVYWPAFLMASGLALPKKLLVHGWIQVDGKKMSKSLGNVVEPEKLLEAYGQEGVRYYLTRHLAITQDSPFSTQDLEEKMNAELADDLGNLLQRMLSLAAKYEVKTLSAPSVWSDDAVSLQVAAQKSIDEFHQYMREYMFHLAYAAIWRFIKEVNAYFHHREPWKVAKSDRAFFHEILSATAHALRLIGHAVWPVMPMKMEQLLASLGVSCEHRAGILESLAASWNQTFILTSQPLLFTKFERVAVEEQNKQAVVEAPVLEHITIEDLAKVHLVVGTIKTCEGIENSDKLYRLEVDCGSYGVRQILAGVKAYWKPEELIGKQSVFVLNLKPRKMAGLESQGMMLCAKDEAGKPVPSGVHQTVANGTRLS